MEQLNDRLGVQALPDCIRHHNVHERVVKHLQHANVIAHTRLHYTGHTKWYPIRVRQKNK
jgi:arginine decarboxylase-like protein